MEDLYIPLNFAVNFFVSSRAIPKWEIGKKGYLSRLASYSGQDIQGTKWEAENKPESQDLPLYKKATLGLHNWVMILVFRFLIH